MNEVPTIIITRSTQCGDEFIYDYLCPICGEKHFNGILSIKCECGTEMKNMLIEISSDIKRNTVAGTFRRHQVGAKLVRRMYANQEEKCAYCFFPLDHNYHVEHIRPLAIGGTNKESNLCLSCPQCNLIAGAKVFFDFNAKQRYIIDRKLNKLKNSHRNAYKSFQDAP